MVSFKLFTSLVLASLASAVLAEVATEPSPHSLEARASVPSAVSSDKQWTLELPSELRRCGKYSLKWTAPAGKKHVFSIGAVTRAGTVLHHQAGSISDDSGRFDFTVNGKVHTDFRVVIYLGDGSNGSNDHTAVSGEYTIKPKHSADHC
ncbi:hypothetical protein T439DRAFT_337777 [Meredithblackwellia eburnea MCA 4105]